MSKNVQTFIRSCEHKRQCGRPPTHPRHCTGWCVHTGWWHTLITLCHLAVHCHCLPWCRCVDLSHGNKTIRISIAWIWYPNPGSVLCRYLSTEMLGKDAARSSITDICSNLQTLLSYHYITASDSEPPYQCTVANHQPPNINYSFNLICKWETANGNGQFHLPL